MIEDLEKLSKLLTKVANAPMIDAHVALSEARKIVYGLIPRVKQFEDSHKFLADQQRRRVF